MRILFPFLLFVTCTLQAMPDKVLKFGIGSIPDSLLKNANCVIRINETDFQVIDIHKARMKGHLVITVLNNKAADEAEISINYNRNSSVVSLDFRIYDALGFDITRTYKKLEAKDESAIDGGTLYSDDRCKTISPVIVQYPVTFEYSYEISFHLIAFYPAWAPITAPNMSLQDAVFRLETPSNLKPRYKEVNMIPPATIRNEEKIDLYTWEIHGIAAIEPEPFSPPLFELIPYLLLAPGHIRYESYDEPFSSWNDIGKFSSYLNRGRDELPDETHEKLKGLLKDCTDDLSRIKIIYRYMQGRTRYIGVQVGIGGWQPTPADYVDRKGYGDCKGLVNYTKALLKSAGIESYYTLVNGGTNAPPVITDFPSEQFNHVILCVPGKGDTTWLECTDQHQAFGFLSSFTDDREALLVTENGGQLTRTPVYGIAQNWSSRRADLEIDDFGNATARIIKRFGGIQSDKVQEVFHDDPNEQKKSFYNKCKLPDCRINSLSYSLLGDFNPLGKEEADIFIPGYASLSNSRYFLPVVFPDRMPLLPENTMKRKKPVVIGRSFQDSDTITVSMPQNLSPEFIPGKQQIENQFGRYLLSIQQLDGKIVCIRSFSINKNRYPASEYVNLVAFYKKVLKADQTKVVMIKK
jgi:hypothetical protein